LFREKRECTTNFWLSVRFLMSIGTLWIRDFYRGISIFK
jgi:hypothetical protein